MWLKQPCPTFELLVACDDTGLRVIRMSSLHPPSIELSLCGANVSAIEWTRRHQNIVVSAIANVRHLANAKGVNGSTFGGKIGVEACVE